MTEAAATVFALRDAGVDAGGRALLRGVSLELAAGTRIGLLGPSGCGKTTLLRGAAGLADLAAGATALRGRSPADWGWPAYRRRVVLLEQQSQLLDRTVAENLARPFAYRIAGTPFPETRARELIERLHMRDDVWDQNARQLSVGQQQRISLIRALLLDPDVMLLDEPASALDPAAARAVEDFIVEQCEKAGLSALIVSHDHGLLSRWCGGLVDLEAHRVESAA